LKDTDKIKVGLTLQELRWQKQLAAEKDLRALLDREFSAGLMNNTKWNELAEALYDLWLMFTMQFVDIQETLTAGGFRAVPPRHWDSTVGPFLTLSIE
jgi:hypothetical protein